MSIVIARVLSTWPKTKFITVGQNTSTFDFILCERLSKKVKYYFRRLIKIAGNHADIMTKVVTTIKALSNWCITYSTILNIFICMTPILVRLKALSN